MAGLLGLLAGSLLAALLLLVLLAFLLEHRPEGIEQVEVEGRGGEALKVGEPFVALSWNLQYCATRKHRFFYDGGEVVHVPPEDVEQGLSAVSAVLRQEAPALCLLQEIDRRSRRTGLRDQLPALVRASGASAVASCTYHRARFVPKPLLRPLGEVDMHLAILSRAPLSSVQRRQLPLRPSNRLVQALDLKRALLTGEVAVHDLARPLKVAVTHLSAFTFGDGTLPRQVAALDAWMSSQPPEQPWILAGDLNLLPPGDDPRRLSVEADHYADDPNPIEALTGKHREVFGAAQLETQNRTYLPHGAALPDRKIDYLFVGGPIEVVEARVMAEHDEISDHLPLRVVLRLLPAA